MSQYKKVCPKCGASVEWGEMFCPLCRHECPDDPKLLEKQTNPNGSIVFGCLTIMIITGFFGLIIFFMCDGTSPNHERNISFLSSERCPKILKSVTGLFSDFISDGVSKPLPARSSGLRDNSPAPHAASPEGNQHIPKANRSGAGREMFMQGAGYHAQGNFAKALECWQSAARLGDAEAMYNIGSYYYNGICVTQNENEAYKWFLQAANAGYDQAQFAVGGMHITGIGAAKNIEEGKRWFRMAAKNGNQQAAAELNRLESSGSQYY